MTEFYITDQQISNLLADKDKPARTRCKVALREGIRQAQKNALARYHDRFCSETYNRAIKGRSVTYANALTDEALAYCGDPHYQIHPYRRWSKAALEHLARFVGYRA